MTSPQLTYRLSQPGDEHDICRLFEEIFGKPMSFDRWRWKYRNNFFKNSLNILAVDSEGKIVGHFGAQELPFQREGNRLRVGELEDGMLRKEFRSQGHYVQLCHEFFKICDDAGFQLLFGFPTERMFYVVSLGGFFMADKIYRFTKEPASSDAHPFKDWIRSLRDLMRSRGSQPAKTLLRSAWRASSQLLNRMLFRIEEIPAGEPEVAKIWEDFRRSCPLSLDRTRDYLHWRYDLHPDFRYLKVAVYRRGGRTPLSFWVVRIEGNLAYLLEGFSRSPLAFLWPAGLDKLEVLLARQGVSELVGILPQWHPTYRMLLDRGYKTVLERRLAGRLGYGTPMEATQGWYYTYGDHDDF